MTIYLAAAAGVLGFTVLSVPGSAHHGWSWTTGGNIQLTGVIQKTALGMPHGVLHVDTEGEVWTVEVGQPWRNARAGLAVAMASGLLPFSARAPEYAAITVFRIKLVLIALGVGSALVLHLVHGFALENAGRARLWRAGARSMACWLGARRWRDCRDGGSGTGGARAARRQAGRRDLMEQRLEQVMVAPVDHGYLDRRARKPLGGGQPAEPGADDHDAGPRLPRGVHSPFKAPADCQTIAHAV